MKKLVSILLTVLLLFTSIPVSAFAAEWDLLDDEAKQEEVIPVESSPTEETDQNEVIPEESVPAEETEQRKIKAECIYYTPLFAVLLYVPKKARYV